MAKLWAVYYRCSRWHGKRPCRFLPMGKCQYWLLTRDRKFVMDVLPFRGVCVVEIQVKTWGPLLDDGRLLERRRRPSVKKVKLSDRSVVKHLAAMETEYLKDCQAIIDALGMLQYEDKSPRQPGYLGIWTQGSAWVVRMTDKDAEAQLTAEGRTLDEALDTLQMHLGSEDAPWEPISRRKKKGG